jgi:nucleoside-diphosphate-sugar epimerase
MKDLARTTALVTGAGGFIGSAVTRALVARCGRVRALLGAPGQAVLPAPEGAEPACAEIDDRARLAALCRGVDLIVHLAGPPSVARSFEDPVEYVRVHTAGTAAVVEAALRAGAGRLVHISSAEVYGRARVSPVDEDHPLAARSPYAAAKIGGEQLVRGMYRPLGGEGIILRPFSIYGPRMSPHSLLGMLLDQARHAPALEVADLRPRRDYCFLDDAVEAVVRAAAAEGLPEDATFNVGSGRGLTVAELAGAALRACGREAPVREAPGRRRPESTEILELVADPARGQRWLGWRAATPVEVGMARVLAWMNGEGP